MVRAVGAGRRAQRILERAGFPFGLTREHVGADANVTGLGELGQRVVVDDRRARGVDQDRAFFYLREQRARDQAARLLVERQVQADHVGGAEELLQRERSRHAVLRRGFHRRGCASKRAPFIPKARARTATSRPIDPKPTSPSCRPFRPRALE